MRTTGARVQRAGIHGVRTWARVIRSLHQSSALPFAASVASGSTSTSARFWRAAKRRPRCPGGTEVHRLKVLTFNILADKYARSGVHNYADPQHLEWTHRWKLIRDELELADADLLFLQEVEAGVYTQQLGPWMQRRGFASLFHPRRPARGGSPPQEGVALHYRTDTFEPVRHVGLTFRDSLAEALPAGAGGARRELLALLRERGEGALIALLRHKASGRLVLGSSCHLFWDPRHPDVKLVQAALLCSHVSDMLHTAPDSTDVPVIIGGDFNSLWRKWQTAAATRAPSPPPLSSGVYQLMTRGVVTPRHHDHPASRANLGAAPALAQQGAQADHGGQTSSSDSSSGSSSSSSAEGGSSGCNGSSSSSADGGSNSSGGSSTSRSTSGSTSRSTIGSTSRSTSGSTSRSTSGSAIDNGNGSSGSSSGSSTSVSSRAGTGDAGSGSGRGWQLSQRDLDSRGVEAGDAAPSGEVCLRHVVFTSSGLSLSSALHRAHGREPPLTTRTASFSGTLDYIFVSPHLEVAATLSMPYTEPQEAAPPEVVPAGELGPLPNQEHGSDHLAVAAELLLRGPKRRQRG